MAADTPIATLQITNASFDVATIAGKVYATDETQNRVLVVDAGKGQIVSAIAVPDEPVALEAYEPRWWTRDLEPTPLLFVACRKAETLAIISPTEDRLLRTNSLPFEPIAMRFVLPPDPSWWPNIPADRIAIELTPRCCV